MSEKPPATASWEVHVVAVALACLTPRLVRSRGNVKLCLALAPKMTLWFLMTVLCCLAADGSYWYTCSRPWRGIEARERAWRLM